MARPDGRAGSDPGNTLPSVVADRHPLSGEPVDSMAPPRGTDDRRSGGPISAPSSVGDDRSGASAPGAGGVFAVDRAEQSTAGELLGRTEPDQRRSMAAPFDPIGNDEDATGGFDSPVPSALPGLAVRQQGAPAGSSPGAPMTSPDPALDNYPPTDPFPEPDPLTEASYSASASASASAPPAPPHPLADVRDSDAPTGIPASSRRSAASAGRDRTAMMGAPGGPGARPRTDRPGRQPATFGEAEADRLQDTEFKLAARPRKEGPGEPNRLLLAAAVGLVVLLGAAVAYFLTQGGDDQIAASDSDSDETTVAAEDPSGPAQETADTADQTTATTEPQVDEPTLFFEAAAGPLVAGEPYSIDIFGEPEGALLQVVVDDIQQGSPGTRLPDLILPPGRHTLYIEITDPSGAGEPEASTAVQAYVLDEPPAAGWRANLKSVNQVTEGWAEAIAAYDGFRAAGHETLSIYPLVDGYWNIFVPGFEDRPAALGYCEGFGLTVPADCFAGEIVGAPADASDQSTAESTETTESTEGDSMSEGSEGDSMSEGGDDTDSSTDG